MSTDLASDATLWVMRVGNEHFKPADALARLQHGIASFGWSFEPTADLGLLRQRIARDGWDSLTPGELDCYMAFLLDVKPGDWVVFPNTPERGKFALAPVTDRYYFKWDEKLEDFCHHFTVDAQRLKVIDKQDSAVPSRVRAGLDLPPRAYRILDRRAFEELISNVTAGKIGQAPIDAAGNLAQFEHGIEKHCADITRELQRQYPKATLEPLFFDLFRAMPGVRNVTHTAGPNEQGADLLVEYGGGLPGITPELDAPKLLVVQIKSYTGTHLESRAIDQVREALYKYRADAALIISTADHPAPEFMEALEQAQQATEKPIGLLIGAELGKFVMEYLRRLRGRGTQK